LDSARRLEEIAKKEDVTIGELLRKIIVQYLDNQPLQDQDQAQDLGKVNEIVNNTIQLFEKTANYVIKYCQDYANEIVSLHPTAQYDYWYKDCLSRKRGLIRDKLLEYIHSADLELQKIIPDHEKRRTYIRRLYQAFNSLYWMPWPSSRAPLLRSLIFQFFVLDSEARITPYIIEFKRRKNNILRIQRAKVRLPENVIKAIKNEIISIIEDDIEPDYQALCQVLVENLEKTEQQVK